MNAQKYILLLAAILGLLAVVLGAFGAHALEPKLDSKSLANYHTAVHYQFVHALAMLAIGILLFYLPSRWLVYSGYAFGVGVLLFSGSIYLLATQEITAINLPKLVVYLTPLGGLAFIAGWALMIWGVVSWK